MKMLGDYYVHKGWEGKQERQNAAAGASVGCTKKKKTSAGKTRGKQSIWTKHTCIA